MLKKIFGNKRLLKYLIMACCIVGLELVTFQVIYVISHNYKLATALSFIFAVILNWVGSRRLVFGASRFSPIKEFTLVFIASIVGLAIQMAVVYTAVEVVSLYPLIGKVLSIGFSFFWNYWFRARFIFGPGKKQNTAAEEMSAF